MNKCIEIYYIKINKLRGKNQRKKARLCAYSNIHISLQLLAM